MAAIDKGTTRVMEATVVEGMMDGTLWWRWRVLARVVLMET